VAFSRWPTGSIQKSGGFVVFNAKRPGMQTPFFGGFLLLLQLLANFFLAFSWLLKGLS
jgi:hypothetical protein